MNYEFKIGWCPFCDQGSAEIVKDVKTETLLIICSECDTQWNCPLDYQNNKPQNRITSNQVFKPSIEEIKMKDWDKYLDKS